MAALMAVKSKSGVVGADATSRRRTPQFYRYIVDTDHFVDAPSRLPPALFHINAFSVRCSGGEEADGDDLTLSLILRGVANSARLFAFDDKIRLTNGGGPWVGLLDALSGQAPLQGLSTVLPVTGDVLPAELANTYAVKCLALTELLARKPPNFSELLPAVQDLARIRRHHTCCLAIRAANAIMDALTQPLADMLTDPARWYPVDLPAMLGGVRDSEVVSFLATLASSFDHCLNSRVLAARLSTRLCLAGYRKQCAANTVMVDGLVDGLRTAICSLRDLARIQRKGTEELDEDAVARTASMAAEMAEALMILCTINPGHTDPHAPKSKWGRVSPSWADVPPESAALARRLLVAPYEAGSLLLSLVHGLLYFQELLTDDVVNEYFMTAGDSLDCTVRNQFRMARALLLSTPITDEQARAAVSMIVQQCSHLLRAFPEVPWLHQHVIAYIALPFAIGELTPMQPPGGPLRWRGSCCTCRRCMPPRRAGAARVTMELLRPMLPVIIQSLNNDARKECTRPAARLLALLAQDWPEACHELGKLGAVHELLAVYLALEEKITLTAPGPLYNMIRHVAPAITSPGRLERIARHGVLGAVFDVERDADDGDDPGFPDLCLASFPCISDCDNSEVEKDPWAMAVRPGEGMPVGRCSTLRAVCRAMCALTGATSAFEAMSLLEPKLEPEDAPGEQPPTSQMSALAPSAAAVYAAAYAATTQAKMEDMERRQLAAQRAADALLAEEEREARVRSKKAGAGAKPATTSKKKQQKGKKKAGAAAAAPQARPPSDDGDGDDEAEPGPGHDDDTSLAAAMQRTGVTARAPPSLFHAAQMEGLTQQPGSAPPPPQPGSAPPPARIRPLADVLGAAAAAGASKPVVAEAKEEVQPPAQPPAPVAPVVEAPPPPAHDDDSCCVVCMDAPRTVVLGHRCAHPPVLCAPCAAALMGLPQALCPVCRAST